MVGQKGFNRQNGRNQAFNRSGNMIGAAASGLLGWKLGYFSVFALSALFGAITVACVLLIRPGSINDHAARGNNEDDPKSQPSGLTVLLRHKPLLVLGLALAVFQLGNAAIIPFYGISAVSNGKANGPSFVATTIVIAQGVMVVASIVAMRIAEKRNYWLILLVSFLVLRCGESLPGSSMAGGGCRSGRGARRHRHRPAECRGARHGDPLTLRNGPRQSRPRRRHHCSGRRRRVQSRARRLGGALDRLFVHLSCPGWPRPPRHARVGRARRRGQAVLAQAARTGVIASAERSDHAQWP